MKTKKIIELMIFSVFVAFLTASCQKDNTLENLTDRATVTVNMKGVGTNMNNVQSRSAVGEKIQCRQTTFNGETVVATLTEVGTIASRAAGETTPLPSGTAYTVMVYDGSEQKGSHTFTQGMDDNYEFELTPGTYTFKAFAYGNAAAAGADKDPLWWEEEITVTAGPNDLDILLVHKLTGVKVVFNAGVNRQIEAINNGEEQSFIAPNYDYTFNEENGTVTFNTETTAANITFPVQAVSSTWTSNPIMLAVENTNDGSIELKGVVIDGISGKVALNGWKLRAGVQYTLTLNLGDQAQTGLTYTVTVPEGTESCYMKGGFLSMNNNWADFIKLEKINETTFSVNLPTYVNETYRYFAEKGGAYIEVNEDGSDRADRTWNENHGIDHVVRWKTVPAVPTTLTIRCLVPAEVNNLYVIGTFDVQWKPDPFGEAEKMMYVRKEGEKNVFTYEYTTINPAGLLFKFAAGPNRNYMQSNANNYTIANGTTYETNKYAYEVSAFKAIYVPSSRSASTRWNEINSQSEKVTNVYW